MSTNELFVFIGGILSFAMVVFHMFFYKLFGWQEEFEKVQPRNKRIFYTIHIALILLFLLFAIISFVFTKELATCKGLALGIMLGYSIFWLWRTIWQIIFFKTTKESPVQMRRLHYLLIVVFALLFIFYFLPIIL